MTRLMKLGVAAAILGGVTAGARGMPHTPCFSVGVSESVAATSPRGTAGMNNWLLKYWASITWSCTDGTTQDCRVCEMDTLSRWNPVTGHWVAVNAIPTEDAGNCGDFGDSHTWPGVAKGLWWNTKYRLIFATKTWLPESQCDDLNAGWTARVIIIFKTVL